MAVTRKCKILTNEGYNWNEKCPFATSLSVLRKLSSCQVKHVHVRTQTKTKHKEISQAASPLNDSSKQNLLGSKIICCQSHCTASVSRRDKTTIRMSSWRNNKAHWLIRLVELRQRISELSRAKAQPTVDWLVLCFVQFSSVAHVCSHTEKQRQIVVDRRSTAAEAASLGDALLSQPSRASRADSIHSGDASTRQKVF